MTKPMLSGGRRFASVQELLDFLPADERALTDQLRELIISEAPELQERLSFNVPYFRLKRDVCFIWPASVLWGKSRTYEGVRFGLCNGNLVPGCTPYLLSGGRKQVYWRDLIAINTSDEQRIRSLLNEAVRLDRERSEGLR